MGQNRLCAFVAFQHSGTIFEDRFPARVLSCSMLYINTHGYCFGRGRGVRGRKGTAVLMEMWAGDIRTIGEMCDVTRGLFPLKWESLVTPMSIGPQIQISRV